MSDTCSLQRRCARFVRRLAASPAQIALFSLIPAFILAAPAAAQIAPLTLEDAIRLAVESDPGLRAAEAGIDAARGGTRQAHARPNAELSVEVENFDGSGELRGFSGAETTFSIAQELELGGQRSARMRFADRELHGAELERVLSGLDLIRDVQIAYFRALAAAELVIIAQERLDTAEALNDSIARRVAAARDPLMAGARAEAGLAEARVGLARVQAEAVSARAELASFMGANADFALAAASFALPLAADHDHAAPDNANPEIARLATAREAARAAIHVERSLAWRNPTLSFGYRRFEERDGDGALVAGLTLPLGVFNRNQGAVARARAEERRAALNLEASRRALMREYATLERAIAADVAAVGAREEDVIPQAERALALAQDGYGQGAFSYLDVLEAQRALTDARRDRAQALLSFHNNEAAIDRLTARFAATLPDVEAHR
jgi:cobalt-zinc-cadmium efflux system outer membrane protein